MIEMPEAVVLARQINAQLKGKRIASAVRGNSPHKFAFYSRTPEEYAQILRDKVIGDTEARTLASVKDVHCTNIRARFSVMLLIWEDVIPSTTCMTSQAGIGS